MVAPKRTTSLVAVFLMVVITLGAIGSAPANAASNITVDLNATKQTIRGFGGMNHPLWAGDLTAAQTTTAFGNGAGQLGMSILRIHIDENSNNWSRELATAQKAISLGAIVFASPWNPPASMTEVVNGRKRLQYSQYGAYATHLNNFVTYMKNNGVNLYAISIQNEPDYADDWTSWTSTEIVNFLKQNASVIQTRIIAPESFQYIKSLSDPILNDSVALANMDILGAHLYGTPLANYPYPLFKQKGQGKELWMTEVYTDSSTDANAWPNALDVAYNIHNSMVEAEFNVYTWWYIRRSYGMLTENGAISKRGYAMSQYTKFVRPGAVRVDATKNPATNIYVSAYQSGQNAVIVVVNRGTSAVNQTVTINGGTVSSLTRYTTSGSKSVNNDGTVSGSGGTFTLSLDAQSVTTFVGAIGGTSVTATPTRSQTPVGTTNTPTRTATSGTTEPTATRAPSGSNLLTNADTEAGTTGWAARGGGTLASDTSVAHGGTRSLLLTGRTAAWNGIGQNVDNLVNGGSYTSSVWVRSQSGTPSAKVTLSLTANGTTTYLPLTPSVAVNANGWTLLSGTANVSWSGTLSGATWYVETDAGTDSFSIDDASFGTGMPPSPTATTVVPPTRTNTTVVNPTQLPSNNMLKNGSFEQDNDANGRPDIWSGSNSAATSSFARSNTMKYGPYGSYSIRHHSTGNATYMVTQPVSGIQAGQAYRVSGWTNIPSTSDSFTYSIELVWRNAGGTTISTQVVKRYTAATSGWNFAGGDFTAPSGAVSAVMRMNVSSLNATIYSDVFNLRPSGTVPATATATGAVPPTATRTPSAGPAAVLRINAGGTTASTDGAGNVWAADTAFTGGNTYSTTTTIDMSQLSGVVPPQAVFQAERYGEFTYTIPNLTPGSPQLVTLYFVETYWSAAGQRTFNVLINGATALADFDIFAAAGGANRAIARTFNTTANASGQLVIQFARGGGLDNPRLNGLTVTAGGSGASYTLTVSKVGSGTVTSDPAGITCGTTCSASYASGTSVTLTASPDSGGTFGGWSGACAGTGACVVTMDQVRAVTATFSGASRPSAGCGRSRTLQDGTHTIQSGGVNRTYILKVPSTYNNTTPYRLVVAYHWGGGTATDVATGRTVQTDGWAYYGLLRRANNTAIFIAPQGIDNVWENTNNRELNFTDAFLAEVQNDLCIDQSRIFATGFSYGGAMSYTVACWRSTVFRAVAAMAVGAQSGCSGNTGRMAYLGVHGLSDASVDIAGARSLRDHFVVNNGHRLQNAPEPALGSRTHICTKYQGGLAAYPVEWCAFDGWHQAAPADGVSGDSVNTWVPGETWAFFSQF